MDNLDSEQKFQLKRMLKNWDKIEPNIIDGRGTMTPVIGDIFVFQTANGKKHGVYCDKETFAVFQSKL
tara:strand:+ start:769 stop:972 length:204 start_codon:yes stop_codon:yes gene_type:complete